MKIIMNCSEYSSHDILRIYLENAKIPTVLSFHTTHLIYDYQGSRIIARKWADRLKITDVI